MSMRKEWRYLKGTRDPFARTELLRRVFHSEFGGCDWCGNNGYKGKLWEYQVVPDTGASRILVGVFCGISCMRSYHSK